MPLSKAKQAEYQKERRRRLGMTKDSVIPNKATSYLIQPNKAKQVELQKLIHSIEDRPKNVAPRPLLFNPAIHKPGDRVLVRQGRSLIETTVQEIDADGNAVPRW